MKFLLNKYFYVFVVSVTLITMLIISMIDKHLTNNIVQGIIDFELAKTPERARQILDSWGPTGQIYAAFSLGIDYLFLVFYSLFFILTTCKIAENNHNYFKKLAPFLVLVFVVAGIFDALENYFLFQILSHQEYVASNPQWAAYFSVAKFSLLGLGVLLLIAGWIGKKFAR